ncbi:MAG: 3'(2'),5'-bisphosphate nucleotidase CysQ [Gammaproteobacteria bacterium]|nr:3'(2'),5'-bisphosphate nucleotidase CysQ [Gammaproteobacteria bacterium]
MFLTDEKTDELLTQVLEIARAAGQQILSVAPDSLDVSTKVDRTPVCRADMAAHKAILGGLQALQLDLPVISEESEDISFKERTGWADYWLVDPLDGTWGFLQGTDQFTVNIALIHNDQPVLGVIVAPKLNVAYFAAKNHGAYKQLGDSEPKAIHVRSVDESDITVACSGPAKVGSKFEEFLNSLGQHSEVAAGAALKSCLVAEGAADVYVRLGPTGEWDTAAAQIIVKEAGGHVTDTDMQELRYNTKESLTNPHFVVFGDTRVDWSKFLPKDTA